MDNKTKRHGLELMPDEHVIIDRPIHWKNYIGPFLIMQTCAFGILFRAFFMDVSLVNAVAGRTLMDAASPRLLAWLEIALMAVLFLNSFARTVELSYVRYYVTDKRIASVEGVFSLRTQEMIIARCEMVYLKQNLYERLFRTGDIEAVSAGASIHFDDVYDALRFRQTILEQLVSEKE